MNDDTLTLLRQILKGAKVTEGRIDALLACLDLSATKLMTLRHLEESREAVSPGNLAQCMAFAKSNATQLIDHLETAGLVRRVPSPEDRRCTQIALTEAGRARRADGSRAIAPLAERIERCFSPRERREFLRYLERLSEALA